MWVESKWYKKLMPSKNSRAMITTKPNLRGVYAFNKSSSGIIERATRDLEHETICKAQAELLKMERLKND